MNRHGKDTAQVAGRGRYCVARPALIGLVLMAALSCTTMQSEPARPDVYLLVIDTLRADRLSVYGCANATSPFLEEFANDAVVYERAISPGTWTVPAHASLFTGMWPSGHGAERVPGDRLLARAIRSDVPTLAELLKTAGYATAAVVGNDAYVAAPFGFARGFDVFRAGGVGNAAGVRRLVAEVVNDIGRPVFLFANILDPHEPYAPPPPFDERFPGKNEAYGTELTKWLGAGNAVTPELLAHVRSQYDGEVLFTDRAIAGIVADLKRTGRYDAALVIVTSDHGEFLGEQGRAGHGGPPFEPLVHVPLMVKYPGNVNAGTRVDRRVSTLGVFATILSTVGLAVPDAVQSVPLDQPHEVWVEEIEFSGERIVATYRGQEKLMAHAALNGGKSWLYDLQADPAEEHPVTDGSGRGELRRRLREFVARPSRVRGDDLPVIDGDREMRLRALGYVR